MTRSAGGHSPTRPFAWLRGPRARRFAGPARFARTISRHSKGTCPGSRAGDVPVAYAFATAWAGWIQANHDDWGAVAELGRVKSLMTRIAELDEAYEHGGPRMYLGVFETLAPAVLGGRPELGREHFERAIELSGGRFLMARVLLAERYGRLVFDRDMHDRELRAALDADPRQRGMTLANLIAQQRARSLLESADEYF